MKFLITFDRNGLSHFQLVRFIQLEFDIHGKFKLSDQLYRG